MARTRVFTREKKSAEYTLVGVADYAAIPRVGEHINPVDEPYEVDQVVHHPSGQTSFDVTVHATKVKKKKGGFIAIFGDGTVIKGKGK